MKGKLFMLRKTDTYEKHWEELKTEYEVNTEQELADKLGNDCYTIPCIVCHKEYCIEQLNFIGGDPYCFRCSQ